MQIKTKDPTIQNEISQSIDKYNIESFSTRSRIGQNAIIQNKVFKPAKNIKVETISDMDEELEQKDNKIQLLEDGIPDFKFVEEMNRLDFNKIWSKDNCETIMKMLKENT